MNEQDHITEHTRLVEQDTAQHVALRQVMDVLDQTLFHLYWRLDTDETENRSIIEGIRTQLAGVQSALLAALTTMKDES